MPFTYTYTARNKDNPDKVMTFTIFEDYLKVNLTGLVEQVTDVVEEEDKGEAVKDIISTQSGTTLYKALERISGPVHINDVDPTFEDGQLKLMFWKRIAGLRFAPIVLSMGNIDNPEAADQFLATLSERQNQAVKPGFFSGPMDYWVTWLGLVLGLIIFIKWPRKDKS